MWQRTQVEMCIRDRWVGICLTTFSTILTNLLAGLFFFVALASWVMKLADGGEVLKMLITAFVVFVLPYIDVYKRQSLRWKAPSMVMT